MPATATDRLAGLTTSVAVKPACVVASSFDLPLTGLFTIGGVALQEGDRVLVRAQTDATENGIWVASSSDWTRALDFDGARDVVCGTIVLINADTNFYYRVTTPDPITIGSTAISFQAIGSALTQAGIGPALYPQAGVEQTVGAVPVQYWYPVGHVYRYGVNTLPGTTDMTAAITAAANVCRQGGYTLQIPMTDVLLVSSSLNFSGIRVQGLGCSYNTPSNFPISPGSGFIQASKTVPAFDVITSTGFTILDGICVDGGWDGTTYGGALTAGNTLAFKAVSPAHPYVNSVRNCSFSNARRSLIYIERGGYTDLYHNHALASGLHGLECTGIANTDPCTSIRDHGGSQYGNTPYGYGIDLTNCVNMQFYGSIIEATNGIRISGIGNRSLVFDGTYQEFNPTPTFTGSISTTTLTVSGPASLAGLGVGSILSGSGIAANTVITATGTGTGGVGTYTVNNSQTVGSEAMTSSLLMFSDYSGGSGLMIRGSIGIGMSMPFAPGIPSFHNWDLVYFEANNGVQEGPIPYSTRYPSDVGGSGTVTTTSDVTVAQLSLAPGTYRLSGAVQTIVQSGGGSATQLACTITSNASASGLSNSVASFTDGAAQTQSFGASQDARVSCETKVQVFTNPTVYYLRGHIALSGTITEAYNGILRAELLE